MTGPGGLNMRSEGKAGIKENARFQALGTRQGHCHSPRDRTGLGSRKSRVPFSTCLVSDASERAKWSLHVSDPELRGEVWARDQMVRVSKYLNSIKILRTR